MENRYYKLSKRYLKEAKNYLRRKNYTQASEKFWGASAEMVKAVAEKKGYSHDGHRQLFNVIHKLTEQSKDEEITICFGSAHLLHINFYENMLKEKETNIYAQQVKKLVDKLKKFYKNE